MIAPRERLHENVRDRSEHECERDRDVFGDEAAQVFEVGGEIRLADVRTEEALRLVEPPLKDVDVGRRVDCNRLDLREGRGDHEGREHDHDADEPDVYRRDRGARAAHAAARDT